MHSQIRKPLSKKLLIPGSHHKHPDAKDLESSLGTRIPVSSPGDFSGVARLRDEGAMTCLYKIEDVLYVVRTPSRLSYSPPSLPARGKCLCIRKA